jgi:hypothetical protein
VSLLLSLAMSAGLVFHGGFRLDPAAWTAPALSLRWCVPLRVVEGSCSSIVPVCAVLGFCCLVLVAGQGFLASTTLAALLFSCFRLVTLLQVLAVPRLPSWPAHWRNSVGPAWAVSSAFRLRALTFRLSADVAAQWPGLVMLRFLQVAVRVARGV